MKKITLFGIVVIAVGFAVMAVWPNRSGAIPAFARKYGFNCTMCHSGFPRLNDFGARYRANGYQLPGREKEELTILQSPPPFAMRTSAGYNSDSFINDRPRIKDTRQFQLNGLDLLSAGVIGQNLSYLVVYTPEIAASRGVAGQTGTFESANVVLSNIGATTWLNVRAGRFEPGALAFSAKRNLSFSPYEIYTYGAPGGFILGDNQEGVEVTGYGNGFSYTVGCVNGSTSNQQDDGPTDYYARLSMVLGAGEGQTAGQRIGVVGYFGEARPWVGLTVPPRPRDAREPFNRIGIDASVNLMQLNLSFQYLMGEDDYRLWGMAKEDNVRFTGGFAELSYMPTVELVGFARFDWVEAPDRLDQDINRWTGGVRYYLRDNCALHLEYSQRRQNQPHRDPNMENFFTARLDFAF